jgi:polyketide cyclase/dehydrase/lipid transport protein
MASITKNIPIDAPLHAVWDAVRDFGAVHTRLAPGFVTETRLEDGSRMVTFANGTMVRELFVDCDENRHRLVYAVVSERVTQHSASIQIIADGDACSRMIWITDVLPHEIAPYISAQMDLGAAAMQKALGGRSS